MTPEELRQVVLRICPACGVVNPSGPSEFCAHVQLVRFEGIDQSMSELLGRVAEARAAYNKLAAELKTSVKLAVRSGEAEVETASKARFSDVRDLARAPAKPLTLVNPEAPPESPPRENRERRKPKRKSPAHPSVDPRQLELISREPPKGDA